MLDWLKSHPGEAIAIAYLVCSALGRLPGKAGAFFSAITLDINKLRGLAPKPAEKAPEEPKP